MKQLYGEQFLQDCLLSRRDGIADTEMAIEELTKLVEKDIPFYVWDRGIYQLMWLRFLLISLQTRLF